MLDDMKTPFFEVQTSDNKEIEAQVKMYARLFKERLARNEGKCPLFV